MRKNKLFLISSTLIIISLFVTAATCNLCGVPIEIGEATTEETELRQQTTRTTQEQTQGTEAPLEDNSPPSIKEIEVSGGVDIELLEDQFNYINTEEDYEEEIPFNIEAYDEDDDELNYSAYDSLGTSFSCTKIDNNNAEFIWSPPRAYFGSYTLTMEVSDGKGGTDVYSIDMNFTDYSEDEGAVDFGEEVNSPPVISEHLTIMGPAGAVTDLYTNQVFRISGSVFDPDEDYPLSFSWSSESGEFHTDPNSQIVDWKTPTTAGDYEIVLTVTDSRGGVSTQTFTVTVQEH
jgi:hypothetical protein